MPYQQGPYPPPTYPYPEPPKKSRTGLWIGLAVLAVVLLSGLGVGVWYFLNSVKDKVIATDLAVGDCITDIPNGSLVQAVPKTDCANPHAGEVYAVLTMPDGEYPGQSAINDWQNKCPTELQSYSSDALTDDSIGVFVLYPTEQTWSQGDREIVCMATTQDKRTGSLKG